MRRPRNSVRWRDHGSYWEFFIQMSYIMNIILYSSIKLMISVIFVDQAILFKTSGSSFLKISKSSADKALELPIHPSHQIGLARQERETIKRDLQRWLTKTKAHKALTQQLASSMLKLHHVLHTLYIYIY